jgi:phage terminase large subunit-like protein
LAYEVGAAYNFSDELMRPSRYKALYGGRGSGKSHFFAECLVANAAMTKGFRALCIREVQKSLKESAKRLIEDKIVESGAAHIFTIKHDEIITPGNGVIAFTGMNQHNSESVKSYESFNLAWVEEANTFAARSIELLHPTIRAEASEIWYSWNPNDVTDPVDKLFRGMNPPENAVIRKVNYDENRFFPSVLAEELERDRVSNPDRFGHIWLGDYAPQAVGAIFHMGTIHSNRRAEAPTMGRVLVSVDPAISAKTGSDEHGITVGGLGEDGRGYLLDDTTTTGGPRDWAERAIATYDRYDADAIVVERNQGGDMVKHTLQSVRPGIKVVEVVATRGKHVRAEPISALYQNNQISHVGTFPDLERQLCQFTAAGYEGNGSPDRADSAVWLFTELFPSLIRKKAKPRTEKRRSGWMG